jgi:hypothetical protein
MPSWFCRDPQRRLTYITTHRSLLWPLDPALNPVTQSQNARSTRHWLFALRSRFPHSYSGTRQRPDVAVCSPVPKANYYQSVSVVLRRKCRVNLAYRRRLWLQSLVRFCRPRFRSITAMMRFRLRWNSQWTWASVASYRMLLQFICISARHFEIQQSLYHIQIRFKFIRSWI